MFCYQSLIAGHYSTIYKECCGLTLHLEHQRERRCDGLEKLVSDVY